MNSNPSLSILQAQISGMDCGSCAKKIAANLKQLLGVTEVEVNFATGQLYVSYDPKQVKEKAIQDAVTTLGYTFEQAPISHVSTKGGSLHVASQKTSPSSSMKLALRLEGITLIWMVIEASVSIGAGIAAGSLLLVAFGVDSVIELISASVLFWRLGKEARERVSDKASIERLERKAGRISSYLLYALSGYVVLQAIYGFTHSHNADTSYLGIAVAIIAALGMPLLAKAKIRVADEIGSKALRADAMETFTCGYLSWVLLVGLAVNALLHWWWLDAAASLVIVPFLLKEAREAMTGDCSCID